MSVIMTVSQWELWAFGLLVNTAGRVSKGGLFAAPGYASWESRFTRLIASVWKPVRAHRRNRLEAATGNSWTPPRKQKKEKVDSEFLLEKLENPQRKRSTWPPTASAVPFKWVILYMQVFGLDQSTYWHIRLFTCNKTLDTRLEEIIRL